MECLKTHSLPELSVQGPLNISRMNAEPDWEDCDFNISRIGPMALSRGKVEISKCHSSEKI